MEEPKIKVGIMSAAEVKFILDGNFHVNGEGATGNQIATSQRVLCRTLHAASPALFTTRAVDYYIYALRHIII